MTSKRGYHHGDLRNALIEAAATLAEKNGHTYDKLGLPSTTYTDDGSDTTTWLVSRTDYDAFNAVAGMQ
ncbi:hypothetical protein ACFQ1S_42730, partial [Kibdelosporangium lantanae]